MNNKLKFPLCRFVASTKINIYLVPNVIVKYLKATEERTQKIVYKSVAAK